METTPPLAGFFEALARRVSRAPVLTLAIILAVSSALGFFASKVHVNNSNEIFFVEDDPLLRAHRRFEKRFGSDSFVMVFVEGDLYAKPSFQAIDRLVDAMEKLSYQGEPTFTGILSPYHAPTMRDAGGSIEVTPLLADLEDPSDAALQKAKQEATSHPVYRDLLVSRDGTAGAVVGTLRALPGDEEYPRFITREMEKLVDDPALKDLGVLLVGDPIFKTQVDSATVNESATFGSAAIGVSMLALFLMFRRKRQVTAAIGVVVLAVVWTVGLMSLFGVEMSLVSIILPLVIIIMGLGSGVHIINEFREQRHRGGRRKESVVRALRVTGWPSMLTAVTTAIGFLTMITAPVAPMRSLGVFASVGVLLCFVLAMTVVPAVLSLGSDEPDIRHEDGDESEHPGAGRFFTQLADFVVHKHVSVTLIFVGLSIALGTGLKETRVESHVLQAFRKDQEFRKAVEHVDEKLGGSTSIELVFDSGAPRGVFDPGFLQRIDTLQRWIHETQGDVVGATLSLTDLLKEINFAFAGERALPDSKDRAAQLMLLYEAGNGDARLVTDHSARRARMSLRMRQTTTSRSLELEKELREKADAIFADWKPAEAPAAPAPAVEEEAPAPSGDDDGEIVIIEDDEATAPEGGAPAPEGEEIVIVDDDAAAERPDDAPPKGATKAAAPGDVDLALADDPPLPPGASRVELAGTSQLFVHLAQYVINSQITSFGLAFCIISVLMVLMLRSLKLGLAVMIPNLLPIVCTYGVMGWTGISVDWLTALIAVASLGVAVDGTIHIGTRYRLAREAGLDAAGASRLIMTSIGRALVVTSVVLSLGFCVVAPSILASLARFGLLMALCLFLALLFDLLMTPAVLTWLSPGGRDD